MPARTGAVGRAGSARAVQATASASWSRSTWSFTGFPSYVSSCLSRGTGRLSGAGWQVLRTGRTLIFVLLIDGSVIVIGAVDTGENLCLRRSAVLFCAHGGVRSVWLETAVCWSS